MAEAAKRHLQGWPREMLFVLGINFCIALLITAISGVEHFGLNLLVSNCIGFLMTIGCHVLLKLLGDPPLQAWHLLLLMPFGIAGGMQLARGLLLLSPWQDLVMTPDFQVDLRSLLVVVLVTVAACVLFYYRYQALASRASFEAEQRRAAELQQAETGARLAMLQAQIEPHFLFNTLATLRSLIRHDAPLAEHVLDQLNDYLRASLGRTRRSEVTLADELALVRPLLEIARIRMGARLQYRIEVPDDLLGLPLPPLLLQPLIENALQHGLEPSLAGGELLVTAQRQDGQLALCVEDGGVGLQVGTSSSGVGLANIRQRLAMLYGEAGRLAIYPRAPSGVRAELHIPLTPRAEP